YTGLDLSRNRLDWHALSIEGTLVDAGAVPPDPDGLAQLVRRLGDASVLAVVEVMNGARFVHDQLELRGWDVRLADPQRSRALAPLACKTDRIDAWVLAELARRDLVPAIWLPDPLVRAERERARWRLHLVRHRSSLKQRVHAVLLTHGKPCPVSDLFGVRGRQLLSRPRPPPALAGHDRGQPTSDRRARARDRRLRARAAPARRRPSLRAALADRARDRLGARLHDRRRDRRHQPLRLAAQARQLPRPLPALLPIRRTRPARPARPTRAQVSALCARRGRHPRPPRRHLPRPRP